MGTIQLDIDHTWGNDTAAEVDDIVGGQVQSIESLLILQDLSGQRVNPEILLDQVQAAHQAAVGELGNARGRSLARHYEYC